MNRSLLSLALLSLMALPAVAQDAKAVWGGGDPTTSAYSGVYVPRVIEVLGQNALGGYTWGGASKGTVDNVERITANPTNLAVGQWDILSQYADPKPFTVIAQDIGPECLYLVTKQDGYNTWGDVIGNAWQIDLATGGNLSGSYGTWKILQSLYPDLADDQMGSVPQRLEEGGASAIVDAVIAGTATHGFFVQRPNPSDDLFKKIAEAKLKFVPIIDYDLEGKYAFQSLKVAYGGIFSGDSFVNTACTSVALITGNPINTAGAATKRLNATIERLSKVPPADLKPNLSTWQDMWDNLKVISGQAAVDLMDASKKALDDIAKNS